MPPEAATWWLRLALGDLSAARALLTAEGVAPRQVAYLAQQAAEKALKATIALGGNEPALTHDQVFLLERGVCCSMLQSQVKPQPNLGRGT